MFQYAALALDIHVRLLVELVLLFSIIHTSHVIIMFIAYVTKNISLIWPISFVSSYRLGRRVHHSQRSVRKHTNTSARI